MISNAVSFALSLNDSTTQIAVLKGLANTVLFRGVNAERGALALERRLERTAGGTLDQRNHLDETSRSDEDLDNDSDATRAREAHRRAEQFFDLHKALAGMALLNGLSSFDRADTIDSTLARMQKNSLKVDESALAMIAEALSVPLEMVMEHRTKQLMSEAEQLKADAPSIKAAYEAAPDKSDAEDVFEDFDTLTKYSTWVATYASVKRQADYAAERSMRFVNLDALADAKLLKATAEELFEAAKAFEEAHFEELMAARDEGRSFRTLDDARRGR